ncbi:hypothetical protein [Mesorhizobium sangaii]|uniref:Uncharacterized protein n=1 Tax=Mesorhizobium sangaii TaxID=505389 RepID=A0A841P7H6_9HYPH|nr:hypothetical protein [Mesorhizobium sangaii]MBB6409363.1 hypothetical protein [Mesorhizobium sangaii]
MSDTSKGPVDGTFHTIDALDNLSMAKHLFFAALMALADIDNMQERSAIEAVLSEGLAKLKAGVATLETIRTNGKKTARPHLIMPVNSAP